MDGHLAEHVPPPAVPPRPAHTLENVSEILVCVFLLSIYRLVLAIVRRFAGCPVCKDIVAPTRTLYSLLELSVAVNTTCVDLLH